MIRYNTSNCSVELNTATFQLSTDPACVEMNGQLSMMAIIHADRIPTPGHPAHDDSRNAHPQQKHYSGTFQPPHAPAQRFKRSAEATLDLKLFLAQQGLCLDSDDVETVSLPLDECYLDEIAGVHTKLSLIGKCQNGANVTVTTYSGQDSSCSQSPQGTSCGLIGACYNQGSSVMSLACPGEQPVYDNTALCQYSLIFRVHLSSEDGKSCGTPVFTGSGMLDTCYPRPEGTSDRWHLDGECGQDAQLVRHSYQTSDCSGWAKVEVRRLNQCYEDDVGLMSYSCGCDEDDVDINAEAQCVLGGYRRITTHGPSCNGTITKVEHLPAAGTCITDGNSSLRYSVDNANPCARKTPIGYMARYPDRDCKGEPTSSPFRLNDCDPTSNTYLECDCVQSQSQTVPTLDRCVVNFDDHCCRLSEEFQFLRTSIGADCLTTTTRDDNVHVSGTCIPNPDGGADRVSIADASVCHDGAGVEYEHYADNDCSGLVVHRTSGRIGECMQAKPGLQVRIDCACRTRVQPDPDNFRQRLQMITYDDADCDVEFTSAHLQGQGSICTGSSKDKTLFLMTENNCSEGQELQIRGSSDGCDSKKTAFYDVTAVGRCNRLGSASYMFKCLCDEHGQSDAPLSYRMFDNPDCKDEPSLVNAAFASGECINDELQSWRYVNRDTSSQCATGADIDIIQYLKPDCEGDPIPLGSQQVDVCNSLPNGQSSVFACSCQNNPIDRCQATFDEQDCCTNNREGSILRIFQHKQGCDADGNVVSMIERGSCIQVDGGLFARIIVLGDGQTGDKITRVDYQTKDCSGDPVQTYDTYIGDCFQGKFTFDCPCNGSSVPTSTVSTPSGSSSTQAPTVPSDTRQLDDSTLSVLYWTVPLTALLSATIMALILKRKQATLRRRAANRARHSANAAARFQDSPLPSVEQQASV
eukprot:TRINITY_DN11043_c0_g1_i3.p1 TRINITY_DN11043_c0_g1~~TRINITY_DN11043_c0_g1_i3.p1  ORF type:complete len:922 (+),score=163.19 TRINITY_DN11043_c0_g1_i3:175-2940(+)